MRVGLIRTGNILKVGLKAILRNKLRSSLTMLGIIIGVACVIAMVAVAGGASGSIQASISSLGTNFIMVLPGAVTQSGARIFSGESTLTGEDVAAIKAECPAVAHVHHAPREPGDVGFVGDQDHRLAFVVETLDDRQDLFRSPRVEVAGRLVGQEDRRIGDQRPGNRHPLLLSPGEL